DRRTDHPIVNHPPQIHFLPMERLHACRWAEGGRTTPRAGVPGDWRSPRGHAGAPWPSGTYRGERQPAAPATGTY
ncbi:hypothetical protein BO70DRAFT_367193, partial [Aspergillus heteromorphus CBS 117.55]